MLGVVTENVLAPRRIIFWWKRGINALGLLPFFRRKVDHVGSVPMH